MVTAMSAKVIPLRRTYPRSDAPVRPYHLWNDTENKRVPYRFYSDSKRAHMGALYETRWAKTVWTTIAVINVQTGRCLGQYTLAPNQRVRGGLEIRFRPGD